MRRQHALKTVLLSGSILAVTLLAGCTQPGGGGPAPCVGTCDVDMKDTKFVPAEIRVKMGATVKWTNSEPTNATTYDHDVTARDRSWQSEGGDGGLSMGESWSRTFNTVGTFEYFCTRHAAADSGFGSATMVGRVVVVQ